MTLSRLVHTANLPTALPAEASVPCVPTKAPALASERETGPTCRRGTGRRVRVNRCDAVARSGRGLGSRWARAVVCSGRGVLRRAGGVWSAAADGYCVGWGPLFAAGEGCCLGRAFGDGPAGGGHLRPIKEEHGWGPGGARVGRGRSRVGRGRPPGRSWAPPGQPGGSPGGGRLQRAPPQGTGGAANGSPVVPNE